LNSENMSLLTKIRELEQNQESEVDRNNYELEIQILNHNIMELSQKLEFSREESSNKGKTLGNMEKENSEKMRYSEFLEKELEKLKGAYDKCSAEKAIEAKGRGRAEESVQNLQDDLEDLKHVFDAVQNDNSNLENLRKVVESLKNDNSELTALNQSLLDRLQDMTPRGSSHSDSQSTVIHIKKDSDFFEYTHPNSSHPNPHPTDLIHIKNPRPQPTSQPSSTPNPSHPLSTPNQTTNIEIQKLYETKESLEKDNSDLKIQKQGWVNKFAE
jgi:FtsZ-binding cell division protein ZapB